MELRQPKIGLAGVMSTPFRGDKAGNYRRHRAALEDLSRELGFDLHTVEKGVYRQEEARAAAAELKDWGADLILLQTSSFAAGEFLYPFAESGIRLGLWAVPEGEPSPGGGLPLNSFTAANMYNSILKTRLPDEVGPVKWFFGHPGSELFDDRLRVTVPAVRALANLPGKRVGLLGGVAPGFDNLIVDPADLRRRLGMEIVEITFETLLERTQAVADQDAQQTAEVIRESAAVFDDQHTAALLKSARVVRAVQDLAEEHGLAGAAISCWPRFQSDYDLAVCSVMGHLNSLGFIAACEGDVTSAVGMLALRALTGGDPVTLMDLVSLDRGDDSALLWHCGPTAPALANPAGVRMGPLWLFDDQEGGQTGLHNDLVLRPGPATVFGFTIDFNRTLVLEGRIDDQKPGYLGSRGWLKDLHLNTEPIEVPDLVQTIMSSGFQHHYPLAYGELAEAALELGSWLGAEPIHRQTYSTYLRNPC